MDEGMDTPLIRLPVHSVTRVGASPRVLRSRPPVSLPDPHESRSVSWLHTEVVRRSGRDVSLHSPSFGVVTG